MAGNRAGMPAHLIGTMNRMAEKKAGTPAHLIGTVCYTGHLRPAPGTWGALAALALAWGILSLGGAWLFAAAIPVTFAKGLWASARIVRATGQHDPAHIVIDEVVGQWIALVPVILVAHRNDALPLATPFVPTLDICAAVGMGFALFRLFDICKPGLVGWAERREGALGIMLDDVVAGVFAGVGVALWLWIGMWLEGRAV